MPSIVSVGQPEVLLTVPEFNEPLATTLTDHSGYGNDGTFLGDGQPDWVQLPSGLWVMDFDATDDKITVSDHASITNIFDGGGTFIAWINPASDGENNRGKIVDKLRWYINTISESAGKVKIKFNPVWNSANATWETTATEVTINTFTFLALTYNADSTANNPILYLDDSVLTVGSGLTETNTPTGTRNSDTGADLIIGNDTGQGSTFGGYIGLPRFKPYILSTAEILKIFTAGRWMFGV